MATATEDPVTMTEIVRVEATFSTDPDNIDNLMKVVHLYFKIEHIQKTFTTLEKCFKLFKYNQNTFWRILEINELALKFWKFWKYGKKDSIRLNISSERKRLLGHIHLSLLTLKATKDGALNQRIMFLLGYVKESMGALQDALLIYSDLITLQSMESGVDLTYIILKAALLLMSLEGDQTQIIEYLEFIVDDPPVKEGYTKTHIYSFLCSLFEQAGDDFLILKERAYENLRASYSQDLSAGKKPFSNQKKLEDILKKKPIHQCSEIWEILALQAIDRCEYSLANLLLRQSINKAPNKGKLWHLAAELYHLLGDDAGSATYAERAFIMLPNEPDVRNLLLLVAREKWQDRLRTVGVTTKDAVESTAPEAKAAVNISEESWMERMKKQASEAIKNVAKDLNEKQKEQSAAERSKRKQDKKDGKDKKEDIKGKGKGKKEKFVYDGPIKAERPNYTSEKAYNADKEFILEIFAGNEDAIHLYDKDLQILATLRDKVARDEREFKAKKEAEKNKP